MILTKDNLLRFVREKKYLTPTHVAEAFDTSTMIASAALSELAKDKKVAITNIKLGSSPYYYDPLQKESIIDLGEKHFSKYDKDVFHKLKQQEVLNDVSLSIQERLAVERIKDFANPLEISYQGQNFKFWVWYLRDLKETQKQITDVLKGNSSSEPSPPKQQTQRKASIPRQTQQTRTPSPQNEVRTSLPNANTGVFKPQPREEPKKEEHTKMEIFIEHFLQENYLRIEEKDKRDHGIYYSALVLINKIEVKFECFFFEKKPKDAELIKFYSSSQSPKIVFVQNAPKKLFKLAEELDNLTIVNI